MHRRQFLKDAAAGTLSVAALAVATEELRAQATAPAYDDTPTGRPVSCGVIGLGDRGREMLKRLPLLHVLPAVAICDTFAPFVKRASDEAPQATQYSDYRKLLADSRVEAVLVATPSHQHRQIVVDALQAGKHVYCEAPLAHTVEDAKAIALAGKAAGPRLVFQSGVQTLVHPQYLHVNKFIRSGALGTVASCRAQWHAKTSWRRASADPAQEKELNWRLSRETSPGLAGELAIHPIAVANWYLQALPTAATGYGDIMLWKDGRDVPDTVQFILEYPGGIRLSYDATLANSFDDTYIVFHGSASAIFVRGERAWMVNEADTPLEGWIVYARKEKVGDDVGVTLVADATKLLALGKQPGKDGFIDPGKTLLYYGLEAFAKSIQAGTPSIAGPIQGYQATVAALKTNEAILSGGRLEFKPEWFQLT